MKAPYVEGNRLRWLVVIAMALVSGACAHPTRFRPAKTLEADVAEVSMGLQAASPVGFFGTYDEGPLFPMTPTVGLRYGLTDWLEIGGQVGAFHQRAELTLQIVRSRTFDLAAGLDLGIAAGSTVLFPYPAGSGMESKKFGVGPEPMPTFDFSDEKEDAAPLFAPSASLPIFLGVNATPWLSFIGFGAGSNVAGAWALQAGGGIDFSAIPGLSLRPHVSFLFALEEHVAQAGGAGKPHLVFGLDFAIGGGRSSP